MESLLKYDGRPFLPQEIVSKVQEDMSHAKLADFKTDDKSWWCPGCGDFAVLAALQKALVNLQINPHDVALLRGLAAPAKSATISTATTST